MCCSGQACFDAGNLGCHGWKLTCSVMAGHSPALHSIQTSPKCQGSNYDSWNKNPAGSLNVSSTSWSVVPVSLARRLVMCDRACLGHTLCFPVWNQTSSVFSLLSCPICVPHAMQVWPSLGSCSFPGRVPSWARWAQWKPHKQPHTQQQQEQQSTPSSRCRRPVRLPWEYLQHYQKPWPGGQPSSSNSR